MATDSKTEVEIQKGDTLSRIAKKAYPGLSMWSGADIISFLNDVPGGKIKAGSRLKIFSYRILKDQPAGENDTAKDKL